MPELRGERDRTRAELTRNPIRSIGLSDAELGTRLGELFRQRGLPAPVRDGACTEPRCRWSFPSVPGITLTTVRGRPESPELRQLSVQVAANVSGTDAGQMLGRLMGVLLPMASDADRMRTVSALAPQGDPMTSPPAEASLGGLTWRRERNVVTVSPAAASAATPAQPAAPADPLVGQWFWTGARPTQRGGIVISATATPGFYVASFDWDMDGRRSGTSQRIQRQSDGTLRFTCASGQCFRTGVETVATGRVRGDGGLLEMFIYENGRLATNLEYRRTR